MPAAGGVGRRERRRGRAPRRLRPRGAHSPPSPAGARAITSAPWPAQRSAVAAAPWDAVCGQILRARGDECREWDHCLEGRAGGVGTAPEPEQVVGVEGDGRTRGAGLRQHVAQLRPARFADHRQGDARQIEISSPASSPVKGQEDRPGRAGRGPPPRRASRRTAARRPRRARWRTARKPPRRLGHKLGRYPLVGHPSQDARAEGVARAQRRDVPDIEAQSARIRRQSRYPGVGQPGRRRRAPAPSPPCILR